MTEQEPSLTITIPEAARLSGFSRDSLYRAAARGDLPGAIALPGCRVVRIGRAAFLAWLQGGGTLAGGERAEPPQDLALEQALRLVAGGRR